MKSLLSLIIISIFFISCKRLKPLPVKQASLISFQSSSLYLMDNTPSIFEKHQWYSYDFMTHTLWSNLDIYSVKTANKNYFFQIEDFYQESPPYKLGQYKLNIKTGKSIQQIVVDGYTCGVPFIDPDEYQRCIADPQRNQFTYLNLESLKSWRMEDPEAQNNFDWHVAFKDFDIKFNNGTNGPSRILAGFAFKNYNFFIKGPDGEITADIEKIKAAKISGEFVRYFNLMKEDDRDIQYFLPKGTSKVIHSSDWYKEDENKIKKEISNYWIVRGSEGRSYFKLTIDNIDEEYLSISSDDKKSFITLSYHIQNDDQEAFSQDEIILTLPVIFSGKAQRVCIDLDQQAFECNSNSWDIEFTSSTSGEWSFSNKNGAIPILDREMAPFILSAF